MARRQQPQTPLLTGTAVIQRGRDWWHRNRDREAQHWYITFCLLMSAAQDHLTGISLGSRDNLNWSVTANYYSMVHSVRMLCFVDMGDFPTSHASLQKICASTADSAVVLDWLSSFCRALDLRDSPNKVRILASEARQIVDPQREIGPALQSLGELRNDSNYEALLIAHEQHHVYISERFQRLASLAKRLACETVAIALNKYRRALDGGVWTKWHDAALKAASNKYVHRRLISNLSERFRGVEGVDSLLERWRERLVVQLSNEEATDIEVEELQGAISMRLFEEKTSLMKGFDRKIRELGHDLAMEDDV